MASATSPDTTLNPTGSDGPSAAEAQPAGPAVASQIADLLVKDGRLTEAQLVHATRVHGKIAGDRTLVSVLIDLRYVDEEQIRAALRKNRTAVKLGELLVELGHLSPADLKLALALQRDRPTVPLGDILAENHFINEQEVYAVLADVLDLVHIYPESTDFDRKLLRRAPLQVYAAHSFLPVRQDGPVTVVFGDPLDRQKVDLAKQYFGQDIILGIAPRRAIQSVIARLEAAAAAPAIDASVSESEAVSTVREMVLAAIRERASDIHLEPLRDRLRIRFRQDGSMIPYKDLPSSLIPTLISRIKIMAGADIAQRRRHQDGRIAFDTGNGTIDIRVSMYITVHGENVVLRLLNNRETLLDVKDIGMAPRMLQNFVGDCLDAPSGVVIITGPTGAGKTTTLYAGVNYLNDAQTSIITAEDPVEYMIDGISQCSINPKIALSYEETLKHIVRQDPDVIVIGEIRDLFSAEVAIQAALTGHKVLTTFHTEDSVGGLLRLLNMNIEAFLISSTVISVVAQRLVRRVCQKCAEDHFLTAHELRRLGYEGREAEGLTFKRGRGCSACRHVGYRGRFAVFELLVLNERVRDAVLSRRTSYEIRRISTETSNLVTLLEDAITKAAAGQTSFDEIVRHVPRVAKPRPLPELRRLLGVNE